MVIGIIKQLHFLTSGLVSYRWVVGQLEGVVKWKSAPVLVQSFYTER